jgi:hypothetical protein
MSDLSIADEHQIIADEHPIIADEHPIIAEGQITANDFQLNQNIEQDIIQWKVNNAFLLFRDSISGSGCSIIIEISL